MTKRKTAMSFSQSYAFRAVTLLLLCLSSSTELIYSSDDCLNDPLSAECTFLATEEPPSKPYLSLTSPPVVRVPAGAPLRLECRAFSTPRSVITWFRGTRPLFDDARLRVSPRGEMYVHRTERSDAGRYKCKAENGLGKVEMTFHVVIESGAFIVAPPRNVSISEGATIRFDCRAEDEHRNATVRWRFGDKDVQDEASGVSDRTETDSEGSLVLTSVRHTDSGIFTCIASNGLGKAASASASLNVTFAPKIVHMPKKVYLPLGHSAEIHCHFDANPKIKETKWTKDGVKLDLKANQRYAINPKDGQSLVIKDILDTDKGQYACQAINDLGTGPQTSSTEAKVRPPPKFAQKPTNYYQALTRGTVTLPCAASGNPPPVISWRKISCPNEKFRDFEDIELDPHRQYERRKRGFQLPNFGQVPPPSDVTPCHMPRGRFHTWEGGNLTLIDLETSDSGIFECVVRSAVMTLSASTRLLVETGVRYAPYDVVVVNATWRSLTLEWKPAFRPGVRLQHVIWYKRRGSAMGWQTARLPRDTKLKRTLPDLIPDADYEISVLAETDHARGNFSAVTHARTAPLPFPSNGDPKDDADAANDAGTENAGSERPSSRRRLLPPSPPVKIRLTPIFHGVNVTWKGANSTAPLPASTSSSSALPRARGTRFLVQRTRPGLRSADGSRSLRWNSVSDYVVDKNNFLVKNLLPGSLYYFRIVAFSDGYYGAYEGHDGCVRERD